MSATLIAKEAKETNELIAEAIELAEASNLKVKDVWGVLFIESLFDSWYIEDCYKYVELYHKNTTNRSYHLQRRFTNVVQAMDSIAKHDLYKMR